MKREPMGICFLLFVLALAFLAGAFWVFLIVSKYGWSFLMTAGLVFLVLVGVMVAGRSPLRKAKP